MTDSVERQARGDSGQNAARSHARHSAGVVAPLEKLIAVLAPGASRHALESLFENRTTWQTIRDWRRGKRHMPQWAIDLLKARGDAIVEHARQLRTGPGQAAGWRNVAGYRANQER